MKSMNPAKVIINQKVASGIYSMWLEVGKKINSFPGSFVMVGFPGFDPFLNRPFSIVDEEDKRIRLLFNIRGRGTELLSQMGPGDEIFVSDSLGQALPDPEDDTILIAGGMGVAPLLYYLKRHPRVALIYGVRNHEYIIPTDDIRATIFTEDGSRGEKGKVTRGLKDKYDLVIACGPIAMLAEVNSIVKRGKALGLFECRMGCGYGICLGCALPGYGRYIRLCTEGPAIPLREVNFEALGD